MSELKYRWKAFFADGTEIVQPEDDKYSKHDPEAEHNPSAFRDILDYQEKSRVVFFTLGDENHRYLVDLDDGFFCIGTEVFYLESPDDKLKDRKLIYFRTMSKDLLTGEVKCVLYNYGYEGKNSKGKVIKKVISVDGQ